ncbi:MAG: response regulator [Gammaproteobacteria bacterium]
MGNKILIVEDTESVLSAMATYFQLLGYAVDCARDRGEAERLLAREKYQVVIADLRSSASGGTEGLEIIKSLRGRARSMLLTAFGLPEIEAQARKHGVDVFLHKPQRLPRVAKIVSQLITQ